MKVIVIGGGVSGITCATLLSSEVSRIEVWTKDELARTTSGTAGAFWYPYGLEMTEEVLAWTRTSYAKFAELAERQDSSVHMETASLYFRKQSLVPAWITIPRDVQPIDAARLPRGYQCGVEALLPVMEMPGYLEFLTRQLVGNVRIERKCVASMSQLDGECDLVINCSGVGARELCMDSELRPIFGELVRIKKPESQRLLADMERPTYIIPRAHDCVLGSTLREDELPNSEAAEIHDVVSRCREFCPSIREVEILSVTTCARPYRHAIRLEAEVHGRQTWIHNYGHCGAGITLSWGCASAVLQLARRFFAG